jgi:hypothetical protein
MNIWRVELTMRIPALLLEEEIICVKLLLSKSNTDVVLELGMESRIPSPPELNDAYLFARVEKNNVKLKPPLIRAGEGRGHPVPGVAEQRTN